MKRFLIILLTVLAASSVLAQQRGKVSMTLVDGGTSKGVPGAVIEVYPTSKPDQKKYFTTGAEGKLSFSLAYGNYTLVAQFLGYEDSKKEFKLFSENVNLGKVSIIEGSQKIETVVKEVKVFRTSQNADTLAYNAAAFKVSNDADVEGLLKKMPGLTINNGQVEAQGETVKKIFVDGKEFFGEDVSTAIKSLPAEAVDKIEVFNKLSDSAEFSGMDDGEGYKAINIVTKTNMRQGQFGKVYAGYGYQPKSDGFTTQHKYTVGGNVNIFHKDTRFSVLALFNNINQQNFSFEDILGVTGGSGGGGGGGGRGMGRQVGDYMMRQQDGVARVNAFGLNFSDMWGRKDQFKIQASYFFNNTDVRNLQESTTWYEAPTPYGTKYSLSRSKNINYNNRLNLRIDWKISRNQSLMARTNFSHQSYDPESLSRGYENGEVEEGTTLPSGSDRRGLSYQHATADNDRHGVWFSQFVQYRAKLGKPGRVLTVDGRASYWSNYRTQLTSQNNAAAIVYDADPQSPYQGFINQYFMPDSEQTWEDMQSNPQLFNPEFQRIGSDSKDYGFRGSFQYQEPISPSVSFSFQYRPSFQRSTALRDAFYTDEDFKEDPQRRNESMTLDSHSDYWTHRLGPGIRYSKNRNSAVLNVYYQRSSLDGTLNGGLGQTDRISRTYNNVTFFGMTNIAFNRENTLRVFLRSGTNAPSITQLQSIFDVSSPQYLSIGNYRLNPSFNTSVNAHYVNSNVEKGRTFMWMFSFSTTSNSISASTWYNTKGFELPDTFGKDSQGKDITIPKDEQGNRYRPNQITTYDNLNGQYSLRTHISYGLPISPLKCNLNMMAGVSYSVNPSAIYQATNGSSFLENMINHENYLINKAHNIGYDLSFTLGSNISENLDFTLSWNGTFSQAWNKTAQSGVTKNNYLYHVASGNLKWVFWKGFTLTIAASYTQNKGFSNDYDINYFNLNAYLGKKLFRNKRGELQIGCNDILNQTSAFSRTTGSGFTQNLRNAVIGRYVTIQFVYNLRHFGKRGSKQASDYGVSENSSSAGMGSQAAGMPRMNRW